MERTEEEQQVAADVLLHIQASGSQAIRMTMRQRLIQESYRTDDPEEIPLSPNTDSTDQSPSPTLSYYERRLPGHLRGVYEARTPSTTSGSSSNSTSNDPPADDSCPSISGSQLREYLGGLHRTLTPGTSPADSISACSTLVENESTNTLVAEYEIEHPTITETDPSNVLIVESEGVEIQVDVNENGDESSAEMVVQYEDGTSDTIVILPQNASTDRSAAPMPSEGWILGEMAMEQHVDPERVGRAATSSRNRIGRTPDDNDADLQTTNFIRNARERYQLDPRIQVNVRLSRVLPQDRLIIYQATCTGDPVPILGFDWSPDDSSGWQDSLCFQKTRHPLCCISANLNDGYALLGRDGMDCIVWMELEFALLDGHINTDLAQIL